MQKIFGIGWAKTGTKTLGQCLRILGYNHQSRRLDLVKYLQKGDLSRIYSLARKKDSFEDWPWIILFKELDEEFPQSKFILTVRDEKDWLNSYRNLLSNEGKPTRRINKIRRFLYELPFPDVTDAQLIERYREHNRNVLSYFSTKKNQLLVVNWGKGDGWEELCAFLNKETPDIELPHLNKGKYF